MRWACLHLPRLPLEAFTRAGDAGTPFVIASAGTRPRVIAASESAHAAGVRAGMSIAGALAIAPQAGIRPRDPALEAEALAGLALWALQFTPTISLAPPASLLLEVGGGARLFGGAAALAETIGDGLARLGHRARIALAPNPTAALMLARAAADRTLVRDAETLARALATLPVAVCDCPQATLDTLADLGVRTLGALAALPRDGLARRFGQALLDTLDRAHGHLPDARPPFVPPACFAARLLLPAPAHEAEALLFALRRLLAELAGWLLGRGLGVMRIALVLVHEDCPPTRLALDLSRPSRDPAHLAALLRERFARTDLPARVEAIELTSIETATLASTPRSLLPGDDHAHDAGELIERLVARLGNEAVCALDTHADHRPERAWRTLAGGLPGRCPPPAAPRPLWLLPEPQPIERFTGPGHAPPVLADGPERIESGWWEDRDVRRDYYVARGARGERLWVFRERDGARAWYVHGLFA